MKKLVIALLTTAILMSLACGCASGGGESNIPENRGNSEGNIVHGLGRVAFKDGKLYYSTKGGIYKANSNGKGKKKLCDGECSDINVVGDWVYYADNSNIYKIRTNGKEKTELNKGLCFSVHVVGDWIYFSEVTSSTPQFTEYGNYDLNKYAICKMRTDGTEKTILIDNRDLSEFTVDDNGVVYYSVIMKGICSIGADGTEQLVTSDSPIMMPVWDDGWLYYGESIRSVCKIRPDGTEKTSVFTGDATFGINIDGDYLYFLTANSGNYAIIRTKKDGSDKMKFDTGDNRPASLSAAGDWLYYVDFKESLAYDENDPDSDIPFHKIRKNGKDNQIVK